MRHFNGTTHYDHCSLLMFRTSCLEIGACRAFAPFPYPPVMVIAIEQELHGTATKQGARKEDGDSGLCNLGVFFTQRSLQLS